MSSPPSTISLPGIGEVPVVALDALGPPGFGSDDEEPIFLSPIERRHRERVGMFGYGLSSMSMFGGLPFSTLGTNLQTFADQPELGGSARRAQGAPSSSQPRPAQPGLMDLHNRVTHLLGSPSSTQPPSASQAANSANAPSPRLTRLPDLRDAAPLPPLLAFSDSDDADDPQLVWSQPASPGDLSDDDPEPRPYGLDSDDGESQQEEGEPDEDLDSDGEEDEPSDEYVPYDDVDVLYGSDGSPRRTLAQLLQASSRAGESGSQGGEGGRQRARGREAAGPGSARDAGPAPASGSDAGSSDGAESDEVEPLLGSRRRGVRRRRARAGRQSSNRGADRSRSEDAAGASYAERQAADPGPSAQQQQPSTAHPTVPTAARRGGGLAFAWAAARFALSAVLAPLRLLMLITSFSSGIVGSPHRHASAAAGAAPCSSAAAARTEPEPTRRAAGQQQERQEQQGQGHRRPAGVAGPAGGHRAVSFWRLQQRAPAGSVQPVVVRPHYAEARRGTGRAAEAQPPIVPAPTASQPSGASAPAGLAAQASSDLDPEPQAAAPVSLPAIPDSTDVGNGTAASGSAEGRPSIGMREEAAGQAGTLSSGEPLLTAAGEAAPATATPTRTPVGAGPVPPNMDAPAPTAGLPPAAIDPAGNGEWTDDSMPALYDSPGTESDSPGVRRCMAAVGRTDGDPAVASGGGLIRSRQEESGTASATAATAPAGRAGPAQRALELSGGGGGVGLAPQEFLSSSLLHGVRHSTFSARLTPARISTGRSENDLRPDEAGGDQLHMPASELQPPAGAGHMDQRGRTRPSAIPPRRVAWPPPSEAGAADLPGGSGAEAEAEADSEASSGPEWDAAAQQPSPSPLGFERLLGLGGLRTPASAARPGTRAGSSGRALRTPISVAATAAAAVPVCGPSQLAAGDSIPTAAAAGAEPAGAEAPGTQTAAARLFHVGPGRLSLPRAFGSARALRYPPVTVATGPRSDLCQQQGGAAARTARRALDYASTGVAGGLSPHDSQAAGPAGPHEQPSTSADTPGAAVPGLPEPEDATELLARLHNFARVTARRQRLMLRRVASMEQLQQDEGMPTPPQPAELQQLPPGSQPALLLAPLRSGVGALAGGVRAAPLLPPGRLQLLRATGTPAPAAAVSSPQDALTPARDGQNASDRAGPSSGAARRGTGSRRSSPDGPEPAAAAASGMWSATDSEEEAERRARFTAGHSVASPAAPSLSDDSEGQGDEADDGRWARRRQEQPQRRRRQRGRRAGANWEDLSDDGSGGGSAWRFYYSDGNTDHTALSDQTHRSAYGDASGWLGALTRETRALGELLARVQHMAAIEEEAGEDEWRQVLRVRDPDDLRLPSPPMLLRPRRRLGALLDLPLLGPTSRTELRAGSLPGRDAAGDGAGALGEGEEDDEEDACSSSTAPSDLPALISDQDEDLDPLERAHRRRLWAAQNEAERRRHLMQRRYRRRQERLAAAAAASAAGSTVVAAAPAAAAPGAPGASPVRTAASASPDGGTAASVAGSSAPVSTVASITAWPASSPTATSRPGEAAAAASAATESSAPSPEAHGTSSSGRSVTADDWNWQSSPHSIPVGSDTPAVPATELPAPGQLAATQAVVAVAPLQRTGSTTAADGDIGAGANDGDSDGDLEALQEIAALLRPMDVSAGEQVHEGETAVQSLPDAEGPVGAGAGRGLAQVQEPESRDEGAAGAAAGELRERPLSVPPPPVLGEPGPDRSVFGSTTGDDGGQPSALCWDDSDGEEGSPALGLHPGTSEDEGDEAPPGLCSDSAEGEVDGAPPLAALDSDDSDLEGPLRRNLLYSNEGVPAPVWAPDSGDDKEESLPPGLCSDSGEEHEAVELQELLPPDLSARSDGGDDAPPPALCTDSDDGDEEDGKTEEGRGQRLLNPARWPPLAGPGAACAAATAAWPGESSWSASRSAVAAAGATGVAAGFAVERPREAPPRALVDGGDGDEAGAGSHGGSSGGDDDDDHPLRLHAVQRYGAADSDEAEVEAEEHWWVEDPSLPGPPRGAAHQPAARGQELADLGASIRSRGCEAEYDGGYSGDFEEYDDDDEGEEDEESYSDDGEEYEDGDEDEEDGLSDEGEEKEGDSDELPYAFQSDGQRCGRGRVGGSGGSTGVNGAATAAVTVPGQAGVAGAAGAQGDDDDSMDSLPGLLSESVDYSSDSLPPLVESELDSDEEMLRSRRPAERCAGRRRSPSPSSSGDMPPLCHDSSSDEEPGRGRPHSRGYMSQRRPQPPPVPLAAPVSVDTPPRSNSPVSTSTSSAPFGLLAPTARISRFGQQAGSSSAAPQNPPGSNAGARPGERVTATPAPAQGSRFRSAGVAAAPARLPRGSLSGDEWPFHWDRDSDDLPALLASESDSDGSDTPWRRRRLRESDASQPTASRGRPFRLTAPPPPPPPPPLRASGGTGPAAGANASTPRLELGAAAAAVLEALMPALLGARGSGSTGAATTNAAAAPSSSQGRTGGSGLSLGGGLRARTTAGGHPQILSAVIRLPADALSNVPHGSVLSITLPGDAQAGGAASGSGAAGGPATAASGTVRLHLGSVASFPTSWRSYLPPEDNSGRHPNDRSWLPGTYEEADIPAWAVRFAPPRVPAPGPGPEVQGASVASPVGLGQPGASPMLAAALGGGEGGSGSGGSGGRGGHAPEGPPAGGPTPDPASQASAAANEGSAASGSGARPGSAAPRPEPVPWDLFSLPSLPSSASSSADPDDDPDADDFPALAAALDALMAAGEGSRDGDGDVGGGDGDVSDSDSIPPLVPLDHFTRCESSSLSDVLADIVRPTGSGVAATTAAGGAGPSGAAAASGVQAAAGPDVTAAAVTPMRPSAAAAAEADASHQATEALSNDAAAAGAAASTSGERASPSGSAAGGPSLPDGALPAGTQPGGDGSAGALGRTPGAEGAAAAGDVDDDSVDDLPSFLRPLLSSQLQAQTVQGLQGAASPQGQQQPRLQLPPSPRAGRERRSAGPVLQGASTTAVAGALAAGPAAPSAEAGNADPDGSSGGGEGRSQRRGSAPARVPLPPMPDGDGAAPPLLAQDRVSRYAGTSAASSADDSVDGVVATAALTPAAAAAAPGSTAAQATSAGAAAGTAASTAARDAGAPTGPVPTRRNAVTYPRSVLLDMLDALRSVEALATAALGGTGGGAANSGRTTSSHRAAGGAGGRGAAGDTAGGAADRSEAAASSAAVPGPWWDSADSRSSAQRQAAAALLRDAAFVDQLIAGLPSVASESPPAFVRDTVAWISSVAEAASVRA